jgi:transposase
MVAGTKFSIVSEALCKIPLKDRNNVSTITRDLAETMTLIATHCFPKAEQIDDRFHVQQLVSEALQEIRIDLRKQAIKEQNQKVLEAREQNRYHVPKVYKNGDTLKELLARSRHLLYKPSGKWSEGQKERAFILFQEFPQIESAYKITMQFRGIYEHAKNRADGLERLRNWYSSVTMKLHLFSNFETPMQTIRLHEKTIVNYFNARLTNASAESFNSKIKNFRALQRGVSDVAFFLYRLTMIYG